MPFRTVIVDDEPPAIEVLKHYLSSEDDFSIIQTFTNPAEALKYLNANDTDVLFLDINMTVMDGLELLNQLHTKPMVVFTTAHREYLQDGFDHGILDYLQKPIRHERIQLTLDRIRKQNQAQKQDGKQLHIRTSQKEFYINTDDILFIKAVKDYCLIHLANGTKVMAVGSLGQFLLKHELDALFVRVHKSFVVPASRIKEILSGGTIHIEGYKIPIGRKYKENVMAAFEK